MNPVFVYLCAVFLILYGARSIVAGLKNENRSYWISLGWDDTKKLLKENYNKFNNILWGGISFGAGLLLLIFY